MWIFLALYVMGAEATVVLIFTVFHWHIQPEMMKNFGTIAYGVSWWIVFWPLFLALFTYKYIRKSYWASFLR